MVKKKEEKDGEKNQLNSSLFSEPYHLNLCMENIIKNKTGGASLTIQLFEEDFCFAYVVKELNSTKTTFAPLNEQLKKILVVANVSRSC